MKLISRIPSPLWLVMKWIVFPIFIVWVAISLVSFVVGYGTYRFYFNPTMERLQKSGSISRFMNPLDASYDSGLAKAYIAHDFDFVIQRLKQKADEGTADAGAYVLLAALHRIASDSYGDASQRESIAQNYAEMGLRKYPDAEMLILSSRDGSETMLARLESLRGRSDFSEQKIDELINTTRRIIVSRQALDDAVENARMIGQINQEVQLKSERIRVLVEEQKTLSRETPRFAAVKSELERLRKEISEAQAKLDRIMKGMSSRNTGITASHQ